MRRAPPSPSAQARGRGSCSCRRISPKSRETSRRGPAVCRSVVWALYPTAIIVATPATSSG
eukprot:3904710-Pyramimonas_sp.AAC.1